MDPTEEIAARYLNILPYSKVEYEPDGNIPPDFLLDGKIAVEVRRLNQHEVKTTGVARGIEETSIPLLKRTRELLKTFGPPNAGSSWFVFYRFQRPLDWKLILRRMDGWLNAFKEGPQTGRVNKKFGESFSASLTRASAPQADLFVVGGYSDWDAGGWLLDEVGKNLQICIEEKTSKIATVRDKYPEWWLVLVDHIGLGMDDFDREMFRDKVSITHDWNKIILLPPNDPSRPFIL